jgi:hypothetical protein
MHDMKEDFCGNVLAKGQVKDKVLRKRNEHAIVKASGEPKTPKETVPSIPGVMTSRISIISLAYRRQRQNRSGRGWP